MHKNVSLPHSSMTFEIKNAAFGYGGKAVLENFNMALHSAEVVCVLGPNGVGKTTMFRSALGFLKPISGEIYLNGVNRLAISKKGFSKIIAYVPQSHEPPFPFSVIDVVVMGRTAHLNALAFPSKDDYILAHTLLDELGIGFLRDKIYTQISGGEQQLVLIARALAQQPKILLMDEPTANLDFGNQIRVLEVIKRLSEKGLGVLMTTHNPDHAFLCCDRVILITKDKTILEGRPRDIVTEENLYSAYGVKVKIADAGSTSSGEEIFTCIPVLT